MSKDEITDLIVVLVTIAAMVGIVVTAMYFLSN